MIILILSLLLACVTVYARGDEYTRAIREGAEARYVYQVVDDDGRPVLGVSVRVSFRSYGRRQDNCDLTMTNDVNGVFVVAHRVNERISVGVDKEGYYHAHDGISFLANPHPTVKDGKWQPYGEVRKLVLKKIRALGTLTVLPGKRRMGEWRIPCQNTWVGFDLEVFDWVKPFGGGICPDVLLRFSSRVSNRFNDYSYGMNVSFTNNPHAGAYIKTKDISSDLNWDVYADTNEVFMTEFAFMREKTRQQTIRHDFLPKEKFLIYRTRTKVDEWGRLLSAHYGIISGAWTAGSDSMSIQDAVFNQKENDPSVEDGIFLREMVDYRIKNMSKDRNDGNE